MLPVTLEIASTADSTNTVLMKKAALGASHGSCLAVELQTHGRGRRGRTWHTTLGGSLTFSLLWRFPQGAGFLSGLSLAVGIALIRALKQIGIPDATLKWPNDILHQGRKLAGILIELQGDMHGPSVAVIGIGINVQTHHHLRDRIDQPITDLATLTGHLSPDRNRILAILLTHLTRILQDFETGGFSPLREEWIQHHHFQDQAITLHMPDGHCETGIARGIADDGALLIEQAGQLRRHSAGEISLRPAC